MEIRNCKLAAAVGSLLLAACYTQAPLETALPAPATRIVAMVTDSGAAALGNTIGPGAMEIEGLVEEASPEAWRLQLLRVNDRFGKTNVWQGQVITFPRHMLARPEVRRLDKTRSWLAAGGIAVGAVLAAQAFSSIVGGDDINTTPVPQATRLLPGGIR